METRAYAQIIGRRKWVIILTTLLALLAAGAISYTTAPTYSASALVRIAPMQNSNADYYVVTYTDRLINTYIRLLESPSMLQEVIARLNLDLSPAQLAEQITLDTVANTELVVIGVESTDPAQAALIANALAGMLVEERQHIYSGTGRGRRELLEEQVAAAEMNLSRDRALLAGVLQGGTAPAGSPAQAELEARIRAQEATYISLLGQYEDARLQEEVRANSITLVQPANPPRSPVRPNLPLNLGIGLLAGLIGGATLGLVFESFDRSVHSPADLITVTRGNVLAQVPRIHHRRRGAPVLLDSADPSPAGEAFRTLSVETAYAASTGQLQSMLVTSAEPHAGKTTVLANLAVALAKSGLRVIVVDGNLRKPALHNVFGVPGDAGLSDLLLNGEDADVVLQRTAVPRLWVLPAGNPSPAVLDAFTEINVQSVLLDLVERADFVIIDSAAMLSASDALVLARVTDRVLFVAAEERAHLDEVANAFTQLERVGARPFGTVYNGARHRNAGFRYYAYPKAGSPLPDRDRLPAPASDQETTAIGPEHASKAVEYMQGKDLQEKAG